MKSLTLWLIVFAAAGLALAAGVAGALPDTPTAAVSSEINYQGRLTSADGAPLNGAYTMRFQIYSAEVGGVMWWDSGDLSVTVANGLFNVPLAVNSRAFDGRELWMLIQVGGEALLPRQKLLPVPYALSLRPGAAIKGPPDPAGYVLQVEMEGTNATRAAIWGYTSTGDAVRGRSAGGFGLAGYTDDGTAVYGQDSGSSTARGYGGYFTSQNGVGAYGYSSATPYFTNMWAPGMYGRSESGVGVYGVAETDKPGVRGESTSGSGVYGLTQSSDYYGAAGVWGASLTGDGTGVRGYKSGNLGFAVLGTNTGNGGSGVVGDSTNYVGVWGQSMNYEAMHATTARPDHNYGLYTSDNIYSLNYHLAGAMMQLVQNGGAEPVEPGDVVEFSGMAAALEAGGPPVVQVAKAVSANSTAVAGVVYSRFNAKVVNARRQAMGEESEGVREVTPDGPVPPGEYLLLVVQGPCQVKVDSTAGAIRPGELLSSAPLAAHAAKAQDVTLAGVRVAVPGTVVGKALEPWGGGQGRIYVFVTLQ